MGWHPTREALHWVVQGGETAICSCLGGRIPPESRQGTLTLKICMVHTFECVPQRAFTQTPEQDRWHCVRVVENASAYPEEQTTKRASTQARAQRETASRIASLTAAD